jgi:DNA modification methylase
MTNLITNKIIQGSCFELIKKVPDDSVTLAITSPPYADVRQSYPGCPANNYVKWFKPLAVEILRTLTSDGSFILNINDKCDKGERIPFAFELVIELRALGFKLIDTIIWTKKNGSPNAGRRRADYFEYIFHFSKTTKPIWNPDPIRTPYAATSIKRSEKPIKSNVSNRENRSSSGSSAKYKRWVLNPLGAYPKNVISFPKDQGKDHVAAFHIDLPSHFIEAHSNPGDLILDPFAGRGTTLQAAKLLDRSYLGFEIKQDHVDLAKEIYKLDT